MNSANGVTEYLLDIVHKLIQCVSSSSPYILINWLGDVTEGVAKDGTSNGTRAAQKRLVIEAMIGSII